MKKLEEELTKEANSNFEVSSPHLKKWSKKSISEEEKKKFREIFQKADINNEGTLNVEFGMKLFSRSKLTSVELTKIWGLADVNCDNKLDQEEFVIAMFLIQCRLEGEQLPEILPENLVPIRPRNKETLYSPLPTSENETKTFEARRLGKNTGSGPSYKLCVVGDQVGKSCLIQRFLKDEFIDDEAPTVEDVIEVNYSFDTFEQHLNILDTSGNETYVDSSQDIWFKNKDAFILVYSIDSKVSFQSLETFYLKISTVCHSTSFIGVVVGTKKDCEKKREVSTKEAEQWASNKGFLFTECSALTGENIEKPFQLIVHKLRNKLTPTLITGVTHTWKSTKFREPATCSLCNTYIWGIVNRTGFNCSKCNFNIHTFCLDKVVPNCGGETNSRKRTKTSIHELVQVMSNKEMLELLHNPANFLRYLEKKGGVGLPQVQFWIDVEEYKALPNEQRKEKGILIYKKILKSIRKVFQTSTFTISTFNDAQKAIYEEIERDYYPGYIQAKYYCDMLFEEKIHNREGEDVPESLWKFENIKRDEAEQILHAQSMPCFLIRASSVEGCSALSLRNEDGSLIHYIIGPSPNGLMIRNCPEDPFEYRSLSELVKKSVLLNKYVPAGRKAKLTFSKAKTMRVKDLNVILQDSHAYESFKTFLQLEYSSENLEFYEAVCRFEKLTSGLYEEAQKLVDKYLETTGECAVNLDSSVVKEVKQAIQNKTLQSDTFQQAKKEAFKLMSEHSLPRFIQSLDLPDFIY